MMKLKNIFINTMTTLILLMSANSHAINITVINKSKSNLTNVELIAFPKRAATVAVDANQMVTLPAQQADMFKNTLANVFVATDHQRQKCGEVSNASASTTIISL